MVHTTSLRLIGATLLLTSTTVVLAHGHDNHAGETTDMGPLPSPMSAASMNSSSASPQSYFAYPAMGGLMLGHIVVMTLAWFFVLPIGEPIILYSNHFSSANHSIPGVMLSVTRSRLALPTQISFLGLYILGLWLGTVYSAKTPDLYENNAHNKVGWIITWIVVVQCVIGLLKLAVSFQEPQEVDAEERTAFLPMSTQALTQHHQAIYSPDEYRYSRDSGHYTASEASRSQSVSSMQDHESEEHQKFLEYQNPHADIDAEYPKKQRHLGNTKAQRVATRIAVMMSQRTKRALNVAFDAINCMGLPLGFVAMVSGAVVYGGVFVSHTPHSCPWRC